MIAGFFCENSHYIVRIKVKIALVSKFSQLVTHFNWVQVLICTMFLGIISLSYLPISEKLVVPFALRVFSFHLLCQAFYFFPGLFRVGNNDWVLLSETGVSSQFCASHLSGWSKDGVYTIEYPDAKQNNGFGSTGAAIALPGATQWRTITVEDNLKPIVETTIPFDVVDPLHEPSQKYKYGRSTWSWIVWQDNSMNYEDQVKYIDLAATLKFE